MGRIEAGAVVGDEESAFAIHSGRAELDARPGRPAGEFPGVVQEAAQEDGRQFRVRPGARPHQATGHRLEGDQRVERALTPGRLVPVEGQRHLHHLARRKARLAQRVVEHEGADGALLEADAPVLQSGQAFDAWPGEQHVGAGVDVEDQHHRQRHAVGAHAQDFVQGQAAPSARPSARACIDAVAEAVSSSDARRSSSQPSERARNINS